MRRKTPQEKKATDYNRQRRSHWDSDKAARKAIPLAKARRSRSIRRASERLVSAALSAAATGSYEDGGEVITAANEHVLRRVTRIDAYGKRDESLAEHVAHQRQARSADTPKQCVVLRGWLEHDFEQPYVRQRDRRDLIGKFKAAESVLSRQRHPSKFEIDWLLMVRKCIEHNKPMMAGFLTDEPSWRARLIRLSDKAIKHKAKTSPSG